MYPDNIFQWLFYVALVLGSVIIACLIGLAIHEMLGRRYDEIHKQNPDDEIPDKIDDLPE